jgi:hypothetical protein
LELVSKDPSVNETGENNRRAEPVDVGAPLAKKQKGSLAGPAHEGLVARDVK